MTKKEYLEILNDYLNNYNASDEEKLDIIRDIEEMVENGLLSGKNESENINTLGSPKKIVEEMLQTDTSSYVQKKLNENHQDVVVSQNEPSFKIKTNKNKNIIMRFIGGLIKLFKFMWVTFLYLFGTSGAIATTILAIIACLCVVVSFLLSSVHIGITIGGIFASLFFWGAVIVGYECTVSVFEYATKVFFGRSLRKKYSNNHMNKNSRQVSIINYS